ncbi:MAG TPA: hypothetical protein VFE07_13370 [Marmoricola sp.]|nr:hypothetical protein [Marmoricola sp.]
MEQAAIELDDERAGVLDVSIDDPGSGVRTPLALTAREPVRTLDAHEVLVLEDGARPLSEVAQDACEPVAPWHPTAGLETGQQAQRCGATSLHGSGQDAERRKVVGSVERHVDRRLLVPDPRRTKVPQNARREVPAAVNPDTVRLDEGARVVDDDVDRRFAGVAATGAVRDAQC